MTKIMQFSAIRQYLIRHLENVIFAITVLISLSATTYFMLHGNQQLGNYDAVARLNIARKITDSLTPGVGQLGGVWLPFPQILMIPLVRLDFLWHSGIAGALISCPAFVIGALYLQKTTLLITKSVKTSLLVWFMFVSSINILLLQTMALSEMFFLACLIMILYYLTLWTKKHDLQLLLASGFFLTLITLTRYEGYFVFIGSVLFILIECIRIYWRKNPQQVEGTVLLFLTVAAFGILLWCVYCFLFYGDFLYWLHLYSQGKQQVSTATHSVRDMSTSVFKVKTNSLLTAFKVYSAMIAWMNGKIVTLLGLFGFFISCGILSISLIRKKIARELLPLLIISLVLFGFLVYGYQKGFIPEVDLPPRLLPLAARKSFTIYTDSNIRYGIILAPCILLFAGIAAAKNKILYITILLLFCAQFVINTLKPQLLQYSLPELWPYSQLTQVPFFRLHYSSGIVLISSNVHEDFMFQSELPYNRFIYEGTRNYWTESLDNPAKYADWVIYDTAVFGDSVYSYMTDKARRTLHEKFVLIYNVRGFEIWHKKRL